MPGVKPFDFRLIDVNRRYVVEAPLHCPYIALSYVWGSVKQHELRDNTVDCLSRDEALSEGQADLPQSVKDALQFCRLLGRQYLWVDRLCIKQDDEKDKEQHIDNMKLIYSCAELTVVSATGLDTNAGLPGICPNSRAIQSHVESVAGLQLITTQKPFLPCIVNS